jgi:hypothetical protein
MDHPAGDNTGPPKRAPVPVLQMKAADGTLETVSLNPATGELYFADAVTVGSGGFDPQNAPGLIGEKIGTIEATYSDVQISEFDDEVRGKDGLVIYRKMLTDSSVNNGLNYIWGSLSNASFRIEPFSDDPTDLEIAGFAADQLGLDDQSAGKYNSFSKLFLTFRHSLIYRDCAAELVFQPGANGKIVLDKINVLHPLIIDSYEYDNTGGVKNISVSGKLAGPTGKQITKKIPIWKTVRFIHENDGTGVGESILRSALLHWKIKRALLVLSNQGFERHAIGVPVVEVPAIVQPGTKQWDAARVLCIKYVTQPRTGVILPNGWKFTIAQMSGQMPDIQSYIEYHEQQIMRAMGIEFSNMIRSDGNAQPTAGQFSVTEQSVRTYLKEFTSVVNLYLIPKLVGVNYPQITNYPRLVVDFNAAGDDRAAANLLGMVLNQAAATVQARLAVEQQAAQAKAAGTGETASGSTGQSQKGSGSTPSRKSGSTAKFAESNTGSDTSSGAGIGAEIGSVMKEIMASLPTKMKRLLGVLDDEQRQQIRDYRVGGQTVRKVKLSKKPVGTVSATTQPGN